MEKPEITTKQLIDEFAKWIPVDKPKRFWVIEQEYMDKDVVFVVKESRKQKNSNMTFKVNT